MSSYFLRRECSRVPIEKLHWKIFCESVANQQILTFCEVQLSSPVLDALDWAERKHELLCSLKTLNRGSSAFCGKYVVLVLLGFLWNAFGTVIPRQSFRPGDLAASIPVQGGRGSRFPCRGQTAKLLQSLMFLVVRCVISMFLVSFGSFWYGMPCWCSKLVNQCVLTFFGTEAKWSKQLFISPNFCWGSSRAGARSTLCSSRTSIRQKKGENLFIDFIGNTGIPSKSKVLESCSILSLYFCIENTFIGKVFTSRSLEVWPHVSFDQLRQEGHGEDKLFLNMKYENGCKTTKYMVWWNQVNIWKWDAIFWFKQVNELNEFNDFTRISGDIRHKHPDMTAIHRLARCLALES